MTAETESLAGVQAGANSKFVTHLECSKTGETYPKDTLLGMSRVGAPLIVRYDLKSLGESVTKNVVASRPPDMWRYREFLPLGENVDPISLGETTTPLVRLSTVEKRCNVASLLIKDEGRLPTGSFKARGMAVAVSMAKALGVRRIAIPTAGNAGAGLAAYASRANIESFVFTPADTPDITASEITYYGARAWRVEGLIGDCAKIVEDGKETMGWFDFTTLKEPYRAEGKKTIGLELAEQYGWDLPEVIFFPTGGGVCLIAMWKVFNELKGIGWVKGPLPRLVAMQSTGCGPIVRAFEAGEREVVEPWGKVTTNVHGVRVPNPLGGTMVLKVLYESNGFGTNVDDDAVIAARARISADEGFHMCPEGAACVVALEKERASGRVGPDDRVVLFNSANGLKSPMPSMTQLLKTGHPIDFSAL